jgi:hypothetical protein
MSDGGIPLILQPPQPPGSGRRRVLPREQRRTGVPGVEITHDHVLELTERHNGITLGTVFVHPDHAAQLAKDLLAAYVMAKARIVAERGCPDPTLPPDAA